MAWILLIVAGLLEIVWAGFMNASAGFSRLWPTIWCLAFMIASFALLSRAMQTIPMGTSYAVWTGIGAAGAAIVGMVYFKEPASAIRIVCILMILGGVAGLKSTH
jgi:quaternary ammonium compound-resistance protein SugE